MHLHVYKFSEDSLYYVKCSEILLEKDTRTCTFFLLMSCADNFNPERHEQLMRKMSVHVTVLVSLKPISTRAAWVHAIAVRSHPGQRYGFTSGNCATIEVETEKYMGG